MAVPTLFLVILVVRFNPASPFMVRRATMNGCDRWDLYSVFVTFCYHFHFLDFLGLPFGVRKASRTMLGGVTSWWPHWRPGCTALRDDHLSCSAR